jgi:hypothetical protein
VTLESDRAELSTLRAQLEDLVERVTDLASQYEATDAAVADDLFASERSLLAARRTLERAATRLAS